VYKLIFVDDEQDVREGLTHEIDWAQHGFEVVGTAENGKEAYELIERLNPDVIITDIMMPFLDGIGLSRLVREHYPQTKIILLTGFDEFEYAQQAVKLHIEEYVLKPFSTQELIDALVKVKARLDEEVAQRENIGQLLKHYQESLPILRNSFLNSLMTRHFESQEVMEKIKKYNIPLLGDVYTVSVIRIDQLSLQTGQSMDEILKMNSLKHSGDKELQLFAVLNIAEEICNRRGIGIVFIHNDHVVLLNVGSEDETEQILHTTFALVEEIRASTEKYLRFTITIGVGTVNRDLTNLKNSYDDACLALDYRLLLGNNRIIYIGDVEGRAVAKPEFDQEKEQELVRCLKIGDEQEISSLIDSYFQQIEGAHVTYQDYQIYLLEILTTILKVASNTNVDTENILGSNGMLLAEIQKFNNLIEAKSWILALCNRVMAAIVHERVSKRKNIVDLAKEFIQEHYNESDISIAKVCNHLHISTGYFSFVFKKEMKTTFVNYLLKIRMEAARELLQTTDLKSFEIAEKVGYADPNYFSFCFKKYFGMTPKECRNSVSGV
jgi:two-component system, response regulator YesN